MARQYDEEYKVQAIKLVNILHVQLQAHIHHVYTELFPPDIKSDCSISDICHDPFIFLDGIDTVTERTGFDLSSIEACAAGRAGDRRDRKSEIGGLFDDFPQTHADLV